jgi:hypothetical protein
MPISLLGYWFFGYWVFWVPDHNGYQSLIGCIAGTQIFSHSEGSLLSVVTVSFAVQKLFRLMRSRVFILSLTCWAFWVLFRKSFPMPICCTVFPTPSCSCSKVLGFLLRSLIYSELILVQGERHGCSFSLLHVDMQFSQHFNICWRGCLFPLSVLGCFVKTLLTVIIWAYVCVFYLIRGYSRLFLCQYHAVVFVVSL